MTAAAEAAAQLAGLRLPDLTPAEWLVAGVGALLIGFAKTGLGGVALVSVALFALVLPARESTGAILPLLILGDVLALVAYRREADWGRVLRLLPGVGAGTVAGALVIDRIDDDQMRRGIGGVLLALAALHVWRRSRGAADAEALSRHPAVTAATGGLAGFTTMLANAAGPVMTLYLLAARTPVLTFLGTSAWFFFLVNLFKVPFSVGLGLVTPATLGLDLVLVPAVLVGAVAGWVVIRYVDQVLFERVALALTVVAALRLLL